MLCTHPVIFPTGEKVSVRVQCIHPFQNGILCWFWATLFCLLKCQWPCSKPAGCPKLWGNVAWNSPPLLVCIFFFSIAKQTVLDITADSALVSSSNTTGWCHLKWCHWPGIDKWLQFFSSFFFFPLSPTIPYQHAVTLTLKMIALYSLPFSLLIAMPVGQMENRII